MYPNILILFEGLKEKTKMYSDILAHRLVLKHSDNPDDQLLQAAYKLILNSTYGLLNNKYSKLNCPKLAFSITVYGQVALYTLASRLANIGARVININTDGVAYVYEGDLDEQIIEEWEKEFSLSMEVEYFDRWIQKDVNNYIAIYDKEKPLEKGNVVLVGGDVNKYLKPKIFANNDIRIVQKALVDNLVYDKPVQDTIMENIDDPSLFQYTLNITGKFNAVVDQDGNKHQKVNRIFAGKNTGFNLSKQRADGTLVKFPNSPTDMLLWNGDISDIPNFRDVIDKNWYYELTLHKLKAWR